MSLDWTKIQRGVSQHDWFVDVTYNDFWVTYEAQARKLGILKLETKDALRVRMLREGYKFKDEPANEFGPVSP